MVGDLRFDGVVVPDTREAPVQMHRRRASGRVGWPRVPGDPFSTHLRCDADAIWTAQHEHPFVLGVADGSLAVEGFARYVRQDYVFLVDYARVLALGAARAPELATMRRFAGLAQAILGEEMELHRAFAREFGISERDLEAEPAAPLTRAYTDFLLRTAALGSFAELAAALLPCMWGYAEIGARLAQRAEASPDARYRRWVETYASAEFQDLAAWCRGLVDRLAADAGADERERMRRAFVQSSEHELAFWDVGLR
jgi:thiaminase (transcriptional activator TenA)